MTETAVLEPTAVAATPATQAAPSGAASNTPSTAPAATAPVAASSPPVPVSVDYTAVAVPQGSPLSPEALTGLLTFAKTNALSTAAAQALVEREHQSVVAAAQSRATMIDGWKSEIAADATYGGQKLTGSEAHVKSVLSRFGAPGFEAALREHGLIHAPGMVRTLVNIGRHIAEGSVTPAPNPAPASNPLEGLFNSEDSKRELFGRK